MTLEEIQKLDITEIKALLYDLQEEFTRQQQVYNQIVAIKIQKEKEHEEANTQTKDNKKDS